MRRIMLRSPALLACAALLAAPVTAQTAPLPRAEMWMLLPLFEANRPVIKERQLSGAERSEMKRLADAYARQPTMAGLTRMRELASAGDKDAMLEIRDALFRGGAPADFKAKFDPQDKDAEFFTDLARVQAAQWTAQVWAGYGYEEPGRQIIATCVGGMYGEVYRHEKDGVSSILRGDKVLSVNRDGFVQDSSMDACGFELNGKSAMYNDANGSPHNTAPGGAKVLKFFNVRNSPGGLGNADRTGNFYITGAAFGPIYGDKAFLAAKFQAHLDQRRNGMVYDDRYNTAMQTTQTLKMSMPWYDRYALDNGQSGVLQQADAAASKKIAADLRNDRERRIRDFKEYGDRVKANPNDELAKSFYQTAAASLGGEYWTEFRSTVPEMDFSPPAAPSSGSYVPSTSPVAQVEIRNYDRSGNYTGSIYTSPFWASVIHMTQ